METWLKEIATRWVWGGLATSSLTPGISQNPQWEAVLCGAVQRDVNASSLSRHVSAH